MDFASDANKPACSKLVCKDSSSVVQQKTNYNLVIIDDDDSCDSAYETGSSVSRTSLSSPPADIREMNNVMQTSMKHDAKLYFYANIQYERNTIVPWTLCQLKKNDSAVQPTRNNIDNNPIVISDSDDDDVPSSEQPENSNSTQNTSFIYVDSDEESEPIMYHTLETPDGKTKKIPEYYMANCYVSDSDEKLPPKTRVIAQRQQEFFPQRQVDETGPCFLYKNDDSAFYAGIISARNTFLNGRWWYLVFFDDGHVQYVSCRNIRLVLGNHGSKYVHENAQKFFDYYFKGVQTSKLIELELRVNTEIRAFVDGKAGWATVAEYNSKLPGIAQLHFWDPNQAEWLYTGSPRFELIHKSIVKDDRLKRYQEANMTLIEVSSDSEMEEDEYASPQKQPLPKDAKDPLQKRVMKRPDLMIDNFRPTKKLDRHHICAHECVREFEKNGQIFGYDPLKRPLLAGWTRRITGICFYVAPCGRSINNIESAYRYLNQTKSKLSIDCFTFSTNVECLTEVISYTNASKEYYLNDLIVGGWREKRQIPVVPIADNLPYFKEYVIQNRRNPLSKKVPAILNETCNPFRSSCDCVDDCSDKSKCSCWQLTQRGSKHNIGYRYRRLEAKVSTGIYECNPGCKCSSKCLNRVVKSQIEQKLEIYETKDRGYGIRCQTDLPKGTFISCYFGDLLHGKTADERAMKKIGSIHGDEYFMQLDHIEVAEYKDDYESDVDFETDDDSDDDSDEMRLKRFKIDETLKLAPPSPISTPTTSQAPNNTTNMISYFPCIMKKRAPIDITQRTILFGEDACEFVVDGRYRGNISRFYNHSCQPNLFSQTVFIDTHDLRFPWLAFFTSEDIKAGTELMWDYSYQIGSIEGRQIECKCGAANCRKRLL